jgi:ketosteroid isomerase-like protein
VESQGLRCLPRAHRSRYRRRVDLETDLDGTYRGIEGLQKLLRFWGAFADFRSEIEECIPAGDHVVVTAHHFARGKSSGVEVDMRNWQIFTLRGGRVVRYRLFSTREQALEAAGLRG